MKAVKITLSGRDHYLTFNGTAMFEIEDAFGGSNQLIDAMKGSTADSFKATCKAVAIMAEQGELARRALGYDKSDFLTEDIVMALVSPLEAVSLKNSVSRAIVAGYKREITNEEYVDLGLVELEQKKGNG